MQVAEISSETNSTTIEAAGHARPDAGALAEARGGAARAFIVGADLADFVARNVRARRVRARWRRARRGSAAPNAVHADARRRAVTREVRAVAPESVLKARRALRGRVAGAAVGSRVVTGDIGASPHAVLAAAGVAAVGCGAERLRVAAGDGRAVRIASAARAPRASERAARAAVAAATGAASGTAAGRTAVAAAAATARIPAAAARAARAAPVGAAATATTRIPAAAARAARVTTTGSAATGGRSAARAPCLAAASDPAGHLQVDARFSAASDGENRGARDEGDHSEKANRPGLHGAEPSEVRATNRIAGIRGRRRDIPVSTCATLTGMSRCATARISPPPHARAVGAKCRRGAGGR
jgi:hypothetical protein